MRTPALAAAILAVALPCGNLLWGANSPGVEEDARQVVSDLAAGRTGKVVLRFDDTMKNALPAPRIARVWAQLEAQVGEFRRIEGVRVERIGRYNVAFVRCLFGSGPLDTKVVFDSSRRVSGLFFVPAAPAPSPTSAPSALPPGLKERDATVGSAPWALPATLTLPADEPPFPAVVLVHGSGPHDRDETIGPNKPFRDLAWGLATRGVAVLRYVKRTKQYPAQMAALRHLTVGEETVDDAAAAADLLAGLPEIDRDRIFVLGHSLGGTLAPRIAAKAPELAGLIIMAGATLPLQQKIVSQLEYLAKLDGKVTDQEAAGIDDATIAAEIIDDPDLPADETVEILGSIIPASYWLDLRSYRPTEAAAALKIPILILQGGRDYQVTGADLDGWRQTLAGRATVRIKLFPQLNHLFMTGSGPPSPEEYSRPGHVAAEVLEEIASWIASPPVPESPASQTSPHFSPSREAKRGRRR